MITSSSFLFSAEPEKRTLLDDLQSPRFDTADQQNHSQRNLCRDPLALSKSPGFQNVCIKIFVRLKLSEKDIEEHRSCCQKKVRGSRA